MNNELSKKQIKQYEILNERMKRLNKNEDFTVWRDQVAKPLLDQWELAMANADSLSEVILRANLKHYNTLKTLFYTWFENIEAQPKIEREINKQINK
jgi:hypothetical protein